MDTDKLIENALSGYADAVPRPGIEQRVLNRVRKQQARRRRSRGLLGLSIGLAAVGLLAIMGLKTTRLTLPAQITPKLAAMPSAPILPRVKVRAKILQRRQRLTGEERALIALVERYPAEVLVALADPARQPIEPIAITPIEIQPLPGYDPK